MSKLTLRQAEILEFIQRAVRDEGYPPSQRDIARHFGFGQNAARDHLQALVRKGEIEISANDARAIRLLKTDDFGEAQEGLPLLGRIAAGSPITAPANAEQWLRIDADLFRPRADFVHRVAGDSMIEAGIFDGDLVGIHAQGTANPGQIVAACLLDSMTGYESITLKRFRRRGATVVLEAENPRYAPIELDLSRTGEAQDLPAFRIAGVMCGLLRTGAHF